MNAERRMVGLKQRQPDEGKEDFMAKMKRQPGTGSVIHEKLGLAIRWTEYIVGPDGKPKRKPGYEFLGDVTEQYASREAQDRSAQARRHGPIEQPLPIPTFETHAEEWKQHILKSVGGGEADHYKFSVRSVRSGILKSRLIPRFGTWVLTDISTAAVDAWIADMRGEGLAASTIRTYNRVLRVILTKAVKWGWIAVHPCDGVDLPKIRRKDQKAKKWALTIEQAGRLIGGIRPLKPRSIVALAITAGLRRGELIAARWKYLDETKSVYSVREAAYRGVISTPKSDAGERDEPVDPWTLSLILDWKRKSKHTKPDDFIFGTRTGKMENPNNILHRYVWPTCDAMTLRRATWQTFRRTFATVLRNEDVSRVTRAEMLGHADTETQDLYIQGEDPRKRAAAEKIGEDLHRFCTDDKQMSLSWVN